MKNRVLLLSIGVLSGCASAGQANTSVAARAESSEQAEDQQTVDIRGRFEGTDGHDARGRFVVNQTADGLVLRFEGGFRVERGPDVYVVLSHSRQPSRGPDLYLGRLKSFSGGQAYALPAGIDPSQYLYVVLWCEQYGVSMARADVRVRR